MIFDKLENFSRYHFETNFIMDDLRKGQFEKGKFEVDGNNKFGIGLTYETQDAAKALWEAHRKYLDIHVILEGEEYVLISDIENMKSCKEYEDDYELFNGEAQQYILLKPGYFLILFPNEVHKTTVMAISPCLVRKKVFKLLINE